MSKFIKLTIYGDATEIYVNIDHVLQMYRDSDLVTWADVPDDINTCGSDDEERPYTRLVYTDAVKENILTDQVIESPKEILELIKNANSFSGKVIKGSRWREKR